MTRSKADLRKHYRALREQMAPEACLQASLAICETIRHLPAYQEARVIAVYHPMNREVDLRSLADSTKRLVYPRLLDRKAKTMEFAPVFRAFVPGVFGLMEPDGAAVAKERIDLILVPGLAFDGEGRRIGYGAGYYDSYLNDYRGVIVGVAYEQQLSPSIPADPWDVSMHWIVTDQRVLQIR